MENISSHDVHEDDIYDVDALIRESNRRPFKFRFDGKVYTLPPSPDIRAIALLSTGQLDAALRKLLGQEQWDQLLAADAVFDSDALMGIMNGYQAHAGIELPNSSAPGSFSAATALPSKPTSNAITGFPSLASSMGRFPGDGSPSSSRNSHPTPP